MVPRTIVTDRPASYPAARAAVCRASPIFSAGARTIGSRIRTNRSVGVSAVSNGSKASGMRRASVPYSVQAATNFGANNVTMPARHGRWNPHLLRKLDQSGASVRDCAIHTCPPDLEEMPRGRCSRRLTVDDQHAESLRERSTRGRGASVNPKQLVAENRLRPARHFHMALRRNY